MEDLDLDLVRATRPRGQRSALILSIVGSVLLVVLVTILIGGMLSVRRVLGAGVRRATTAVEQDLPEGLSQHRREEIRRRLECVVEEAGAGRLDGRELGEFTRTCARAVADGRVDADELREIETRAIALCVAAGGGIR